MPLLEDDEDALKSKGYKYEVTEDGDNTLLTIKDHPLVDIYNVEKVDILILIPKLYPVSPLDMFWVYPEVKLKNGNVYPPSADVFENHVGRSWQRFSRHYTWRPNIDCVHSHLTIAINTLNSR